MATMLVTINISKGWDTWSKMARDLEPQTVSWSKILWAGCDADETAFMFWSRHRTSFHENIWRETRYCCYQGSCGADVSSTVTIAQIGNYFLG